MPFQRSPITCRALVAATVGLALGAACTSDGDEPTATSTPVTTLTPEEPVGDGQLKIGLLLPTTDPRLGEPLVQAARDAVDKINESGGVLGEQVVLVVEDEGSATATALTAIEALIAAGVDAIVGPASSTIALTTLDEIVSAGRLACSPTASALALDGFPDDNLFFRTIPSDSLQAEAITRVAERTGTRQVALAYIDDAYGRPFADAVASSLENSIVELVAAVPFASTDDDLSDNAAELVDSGASSAIVLGAGLDTTRFLDALAENDGYLELRRVVLNDAARAPGALAGYEALPALLRTRIVGVAPQAIVENGQPGAFANNVVDCINLIALGALQADSDTPRLVAGQLFSVSTGGATCLDFAPCAEEIDAGLQIDYGGASGVVDIAGTGDPERAVFDLFEFDDTGRDVTASSLTVTASS